MSDIKRYGVWDKPPREDLVTYADHEAAIEQAYSDGESSGAADWQLKIIEVIERHDTGGIMSPDAEGIMGDLRALTQPQSEEKKFIRQGADGSTEFVSTSGGGAATEECDCPSLLDCRENAGAIPADCAYAALMEGGAATPRGVADADLEGEGVYEAVYACLDACGGTMGSTALHFLADLDERGFRVVRATHESFTEEPGPYAKAFRERVCPVPEFPGIKKEES